MSHSYPTPAPLPLSPRTVPLLILILLTSFGAMAQENADSTKKSRDCEPKNIQEVLFKKAPAPPDTTRKVKELITPGQDMIEGVWIVDAQRSCHRAYNSLVPSNCQTKIDI